MNSFSVFGQCEILAGFFVVKASPGKQAYSTRYTTSPICSINAWAWLTGLVVIAVGGGGIPVVEDQDGLKGIDAMIDKDKSCSEACYKELKADMLIILTAADCVCINFNKPDQRT